MYGVIIIHVVVNDNKLSGKTPIHLLVITTAQLHSTKSELLFCAGSSPARGVLEIHYGVDL